jgi:putative ABC transport system permease protein
VDRVQFYTNNAMVRNESGESFGENVAFATPNFFQVFDFELDSRDRNPLNDLNSVVLTEDFAVKYFGRSDVVGEVIDIRIGDQFEPHKITAMIHEMPYNSSLQFEIMVPMDNVRKILPPSNFESWFFGLIETYILLDPGLEKVQMEQSINKLIASAIVERADDVEIRVELQPLPDVHLSSEFPAGIAQTKDPGFLYILAAVTILILMIACINFTTMAISSATRRSHDVGIRKSIGAHKSQLFTQYMVEAVILTMVSVIFAVTLAESGLVFFNDLFNTRIDLQFDPIFIALLGLLILIVSFAAGFYPSLVLASFKPIRILRNQMVSGGSNRLRKSLVVFQFSMSLLMIASTLIIQKQMKFIEKKDLGYVKDMLITADLNSPNVPGLNALLDTGFYKAELIKSELEKFPDPSSQ